MGIHVAPQAKTILFVNEIILIILICFRLKINYKR